MQRVENVKRPLNLGELFLVPCIVRNEFSNKSLDEQEVWMDLIPFNNNFIVKYITPVINHPHSDKENGQNEVHYHADYRFLDSELPISTRVIKKDIARPKLKLDGNIEYFVLPVKNELFSGATSVSFIKNSKLKHKCIHKGKCPHRGYDLSQVKPVNGKITCPLHGLEFDFKTKKIINL